MKFSFKLSCAITVLLAVSLSVGGYLLVRGNFQDALQQAVKTNTGQHLMDIYALESEMLDLAGKYIEPDNNHLVRYGSMLTDYMAGQERWIGIYDADKQEIFTNFGSAIAPTDRQKALAAGQDSYLLRKAEDKTVMLIASEVKTPSRTVWLLSAYPMTTLFAERERQMRSFWQMEGIVLAGSAIIIVFLTSRITRPIRRLSLVSRKIASGAYNVRTGFETDDEVGQLGRNFDKMAGAIEQKVEALNESLQQRDDFMSAFTHEIKTPMTSIIGYSDILRSSEYEPAIRQKAANYIYHESKRLESLSLKLLMLMGLSGEQPRFEPVQVNSMFAQVGRSVLPLFDGIKPDFLPAGETHVLADRDLAVDLLRNLMLNAAKAEPKDGLVHVSWKQEEDRIRIFVRDKGLGIPEDEIKRITEPFYMVDKSRARAEGGSGLGLALCEKIAALHGGTLHIESKMGEGTSVSFTLGLAEKAV